MKLTFEIELQSDYHVASGHGSGAIIDSALFKESDGVPVQRGTTPAGLLRDGLRELLQHPSFKWLNKELCSDAKGESTTTVPDKRFCKTDPCPVCRIFGSPAASKEWTVSSARPTTAPTMRATPIQAGAGTNLANRSAADPRRKRTDPGKLFNREQGEQQLRFRFDVEGPDGPRGEHDGSLVVAAARMVRHLGLSRRRGSGSCVFKLVAVNGDAGRGSGELQSQWLKRFEERWLRGETRLPAAAKQPVTAWTSNPAPSDEASRRFEIILLTREPVLVATARQSGNEIAGAAHIPGAALLGAFAGRAARRWDLKDPASDLYRAFSHVFRRGGVRFPMLYPLGISGGDAFVTVPAPRDLLDCRRWSVFGPDKHTAIQGATEEHFPLECPECVNEGGEASPLDRINDYVMLNKFRPMSPRMCEEMHVHIDPESKTAAEGDLFSYCAIDAGQYFFGELHFADDHAVRDFQLLVGLEITGDPAQINTTLRLGRASRRGYGLVDLQATEKPFVSIKGKKQPSQLTPTTVDQRVTSLDEPFSLLFLTDSILLDNWGRYRLSITEDWIKQVILAGLDVEVRIRNQFIDVQPVGGFFAHIGLPRQREYAIAAGSAIGFEIVDPKNATRNDLLRLWSTLERNGIGLRRHEGFGRIALNHPVYLQQPTSGAKLEIPQWLRLDDTDSDKCEIQSLMLFIKSWSAYLDESVKPNDFSKSPWLGMGQWLMGRDAQELDGIIDQLAKLSQRKDDVAGGRALTGADSPGDPRFMFEFAADPFRATNAFADKGKELPSLRILIEVLENLRSRTDQQDAEKRTAGFRMLGGAVVAASKSTGKRDN